MYFGFNTLRAALGTGHRQTGGVEQAGLRQHAGLIPIDVLMRDFVTLEADDNGNRHLDGFPGRRHAGQQPVNDRRVGEADEELLDDPILSDGTRHVHHLHVRRKELADEMIAIEGANTVPGRRRPPWWGRG